MKKAIIMVSVALLSSSFAAGLSDQVGYFLRANGETIESSGLCKGSAVISRLQPDRKTTISKMNKREFLEKINDNYMNSFGFLFESEKTLNDYKVIRFRSTEIYRGYFVISIKEVRDRAIVCSISYRI